MNAIMNAVGPDTRICNHGGDEWMDAEVSLWKTYRLVKLDNLLVLLHVVQEMEVCADVDRIVQLKPIA